MARAEVVVELNQLLSDGTIGPSIGTVTLSDSEYGLLVSPNLEQLEPGLHGFHIHANPTCEAATNSEGKLVPGLMAGGHFDPEETGTHLGPYAEGGHLGDLPVLYVDSEGVAAVPSLAPKVTESDLAGRALIVHAGADNYSDIPSKLGGGGARFACGVF
ncbi:superoxide dismutase family protein [Synechococcus sp. PCC 7336]|uniref:superoxide dismutase family protein n=1 Tax=Synechococcus sp. PCC 7336 TaxID=195250 RepID=UPI000377CAEC|nr:superoxide dismutase family protein [Synechococcus sp. PCC 7336]